MLKKGDVLDARYEILEKIGSGGMSVVYKAKDNRLGRIVAIKILREEFINDSNFITKFNVEAKAIAQISHPNIVNIYDVGNMGQIYYIVMEHIDGETLKEVISRKGPLAENEILSIAIQITSALFIAHKNEIIHSDIKPHNIIITSDNRVKVMDFGIAKFSDKHDIKFAANAIGSVYYFSPEQAKGRNVDERSDLYSLGIVMFEMATKKLPFEGNSPREIADKHLNMELPRPSIYNSTISKSLEEIIIKMTNKDKEDRFLDADEALKFMNLSTVKKVETKVPSFLREEAEEQINKIEKKVEVTENTLVLEEPKKEEVKEIVEEKTIVKSNIKVSSKNPFDDDRDTIFSREEEKKDKFKTFFMVVGAFVTAALAFIIFLNIVQNIVSASAKEIKMPGLVGIEASTVNDILEERRLKAVSIKEEYSYDYKKGIIISQSPEVGKVMTKDDEISLIISKGSKPFWLSSYKDMTKEKAIARAEKEGLEVEIVEIEGNSMMEAGIVINQVPEAKIYDKRIKKLTLYVSKKSPRKEVVETIAVEKLEKKKYSIDAPGFIKSLGIDEYSVSMKIIMEDKTEVFSGTKTNGEFPFDLVTDKRGEATIFYYVDGEMIEEKKEYFK
ncbi:MAG: Stk1 family PASTA domain-containing Ser/Thr kinase [Clostridia bacterium]|jgi:serine/threonine-protein kinase|nr:Stk1 family PASTA domain-containing Ser/Thr kinase [Clostridia bacterium]